MDSSFSWQNSASLCPASFCTPRPNLPFTPGISWLPTSAFKPPMMKRTFCFDVLESLTGLHRTVQLLQHYWLGHTVGLLWYWMVCLGNEQIIVILEIGMCLNYLKPLDMYILLFVVSTTLFPLNGLCESFPRLYFVQNTLWLSLKRTSCGPSIGKITHSHPIRLATWFSFTSWMWG